ncbi:MAG TPA: rhomboid family intramembrane serine protease [Edaphobacter sp.]|nr:rhomboid family intramembrane serine protease [Edaphobacter sp.]
MIRFRAVPMLTLCVLLITVTLSCVERLYPALLLFLWRDPVAFSHHQWWRLLTPLLVQPDPWPQALSVFLLFLVVGTLSERLWTRTGWLSFYFAGGLAGEIAGYIWQPYDAGMSVAGAGLLGGLAGWMISSASVWQVKLGGLLILLGALVLIWRSDIHGPPILVGCLIGVLVIRTESHAFIKIR